MDAAARARRRWRGHSAHGGDDEDGGGARSYLQAALPWRMFQVGLGLWITWFRVPVA